MRHEMMDKVYTRSRATNNIHRQIVLASAYTEQLLNEQCNYCNNILIKHTHTNKSMSIGASLKGASGIKDTYIWSLYNTNSVVLTEKF